MSYDAVLANASEGHHETDPFTLDRYRQFESVLPNTTKHVLDVGCNTGRGGALLKSRRPQLELHGLDLVRSRLDRLPAGVFSGTICGSATKIPVNDASFDAIVAGEFIEHLPPNDVSRFLSEAFRVLAIGGVLALTTPNPMDIKRRYRGQTILGGSHVSQHHASTLTVQLQMAGFGFVQIRGSGKVSRLLGTRFPFFSVYGSYLAVAKKY